MPYLRGYLTAYGRRWQEIRECGELRFVEEIESRGIFHKSCWAARGARSDGAGKQDDA
jgi:hypothetical protein